MGTNLVILVRLPIDVGLGENDPVAVIHDGEQMHLGASRCARRRLVPGRSP
ncbi:hypothetical protein [Micromonospora sp. KC606]|uniref:hypothetical protein n=1 Tax=Micromonospora sp. KC606 TaxID=2530379 RepID=UPI001A9D1DA0|nr:hypothetical protein [Micromonospora sp. KC606]